MKRKEDEEEEENDEGEERRYSEKYIEPDKTRAIG